VPQTPPPLVGFNNNVRHHGRIFHIQTEDSGVKRPHVITHLFGDGGRILKSMKTDYSEHLGRDDTQATVRRLMKEQHKAMFVALRSGELDPLIEEAFGPLPKSEVENAPVPEPVQPEPHEPVSVSPEEPSSRRCPTSGGRRRPQRPARRSRRPPPRRRSARRASARVDRARAPAPCGLQRRRPRASTPRSRRWPRRRRASRRVRDRRRRRHFPRRRPYEGGK
jgi:hypothetical protein